VDEGQLSGTGSYPILNASGDVIDSALGASGIGACTNQFWRTGNSDAAPTCETVGTEDVSAGLKTWTKDITILIPWLVTRAHPVNSPKM
jgi:hypothetical protein